MGMGVEWEWSGVEWKDCLAYEERICPPLIEIIQFKIIADMEDMARIAHENSVTGGRLQPEFEDLSMMLFEMDVDVDVLAQYVAENRKKTLDRTVKSSSRLNPQQWRPHFYLLRCCWQHPSLREERRRRPRPGICLS